MRYIRIAFLFLFFSGISGTICAGEPSKNVLLLNSYHNGYLWSDGITNGVQRAFSGSSVELHIDYMDTKRQFGSDYQKLLSQILSLKHNRHKYDAVIVSDDNAFNFVSENREQIFGSTPLIFCGVNYLQRQRLEGMPNVTGVNEQADINANLNLIRKIHPDCRKIVIITDNTTTGKRIQEEVGKIRADRNGRSPEAALMPELELIYDVGVDELIESLHILDKETIVLYTFFFRDKNGVFLEYDIGAELVSENSKRPVYVAWDFSFGKGAVGGYLVTGIDQGIEAGRKALAILNGTRPEDIPIQYDTPAQLTFDFRQLKRHGISLSQIPQNAAIYHQPTSSYEQHKKLIWFMVPLGVLLTAALLGVSYGLVRSRQAEKEIKDFKKALDSSTDAIGMATPEGKHYYQNQTFSEMFGDIGNDPPETLYVDETAGREIFKTIMAGNEWRGDVAMYGKNNEVLDIFLRAYPVERDGKLVALVGVHTDITARKQSAAQLQKIDKLKSIGILAGGIAHDFNNVLTGLFGNISIAKLMLGNDHPAFTSLEKAEKSMDRATRLTNQLLTFSKGGHPVKEDADLGRFIEEMVLFDLSGSHVKPVFRIAENLWRAEVDKGQIQQVFSNLTINADQAMPDSGHLYITVENFEVPKTGMLNLEPGNYIRITMADEGIGIDPNHIELIFDPYFSTKQAGSGLGLATVYSIIKKHGGLIRVASEPGKGTTFTLYLPASHKAQPPGTKHRQTKRLTCPRTARILVMDDEEVICEIAAEMLGAIGYEVETADDGKSALKKYRQSMAAGTPFDLVIMDLTIRGGMGGLEAIRALLAIDPHAKAIVSSGYAQDPVMANYDAYGFRGIVAKPYALDQLQRALDRVLSGR